MDAVTAQLASAVEFPIDFEGQKHVDRIVTYSVAAASILSVALGFLFSSVLVLAATFAAVLLSALVAVAPAWPHYKKNPVSWLDVKYAF